MNTALLFPGQGAQSPGFLHRLPDHPAVHRTLAEAALALGTDVLQMDTPQGLQSSATVQQALVIAGVAVARALRDEGVQVDAVAGLSVGAFSAAVACECLGLRDALALVRLRGDAMDRSYPKGYGMQAIVGIDERQAERIVQASTPPLYLATVNAPLQVVLAGSDRALAAAEFEARRAGARKIERLAVHTPSHCVLLEDVARELAHAMTRLELHPPKMLYASNMRGRALRDAEEIRADLIGNVAHTVRWHDATSILFELGVRLFIEVPPGNVLTRLAKSAFGDARSVSVEESGMDGALHLGVRSRIVGRESTM